MKQDAPSTNPHGGNFASPAPVIQRATADGQTCQQLLLANEAGFQWRYPLRFALRLVCRVSQFGNGILIVFCLIHNQVQHPARTTNTFGARLALYGGGSAADSSYEKHPTFQNWFEQSSDSP